MILYAASTGGFYPTDFFTDFPEGSVEITKEYYKELISSGQPIIPNENGYPILLEIPQPTVNDLIKNQIIALESQQTPRRMREALLGTDNGWLAGIESQIEILRARLVNL